VRLKAKGLAEQEKKSSAGGDGLTAEEEERVLTNTCSNAGLARGGTNNNPEEFGEEALASPLTRARPLTAGVCGKAASKACQQEFGEEALASPLFSS